MGIRITVTFDEDVFELIERESHSRGISFRKAVNDLLRTSIVRASSETRGWFRVQPTHMGKLRASSCDDIEGLLSFAEGEDHL